MLEVATDALVHSPAGTYLDGTFGCGGHSLAILDRLSYDGRLLAIDRDPYALAVARNISDPRFSIEQTTFADLYKFKNLAGILLDLGMSSTQLDNPSRGFSFIRNGPLDMRMDPEHGISAKQWIAQASVDEIAHVFKVYGEERYARRFAYAIDKRRRTHPIEHTIELAELLKQAHPVWEKHPATRAFQAMRMNINDELGQLHTALESAMSALAVGGHIVVISFHSLEDRIIKRFIHDHELLKVGKPHRPSAAEIKANPRARSAVLRVVARS